MKPHIHFMGIGGVGMSGLAHWYKKDGYRVSGCDLSEAEVLASLRQEGIEVVIGHDSAHMEDADILVSTMAVPSNHAEIKAARNQGKRCLRRIELLAELLASKPSINVTGTHGKSTTTGMIATVFLESGQDPSVLIGAQLAGLGSNVRYGKGERVISEVDESDPGFAELQSDIGIVTNLEDDHIANAFDERRNYHASFEDLIAAAQRFTGQARQVLYCADWPGLGKLLEVTDTAYSYGLREGADYYGAEVELELGHSTFSFVTPEGDSVRTRLNVPGEYNVQNAVAALATAHLAGLDIEQASEALANFRGVGRRWQRWGSFENALIIDDYAHHPTEVKVTLETARRTGRRVRAVLQPHRWVRTAQHWPALADAASLADEVLVLDVYAAGEEAIPGISPELIVERLRQGGNDASYHNLDSAQDYLASSLESGDLVITLGAGDVWKVAEGLLASKGGDDGSA